MKEKIIIFCDGSSLGNPGSGGWGVIIVHKNTVDELGGREDYTTNNKMELTAAINALAHVPDSGATTVYTDSTYVINGMTKWTHGWKKNGWQTTQKKEVENKELWLELLRISDGKDIEWHYVGGHIGIAGNERADEIATRFAKAKDRNSEYKPGLYSGFLSEYKIKNILDITPDAQKKSAKMSLRKHSNAKAYSYLSMVNEKIVRHTSWAECEKRVKGIKGAKYRKALNAKDEQEIVKEWNK